MNNKLSYILLLAFTLFVNQSYSQTPAIDSIRNLIPTLEGMARLDAYFNLCELDEVNDKTLNVKIKFLDEYIQEAIRQGNSKEELYARFEKLSYYYNENFEDELFESLPAFMELSLNYKYPNSYFRAYDLKIRQHLYANRIQTALREAQEMYKVASDLNDTHGLGIASFNMGLIYDAMRRDDEAVKLFSEAIDFFNKIREDFDKTILITVYKCLCERLIKNEKYDEALSGLQDLNDVMIAIEQKHKDLGVEINLEMYWFYYEIHHAEVYMHTDNVPLAVKYIEKAKQRTEKNDIVPKTTLHRAYIALYEQEGKYELALSLTDQQYQDEIEYGDFKGTLSTIGTKASLLLKVGRGIESAELYQEFIAKNDSLRSLELNA